MRGSKTTLTDASKKIYSVLKKFAITDLGFGIITQVKNRKDHRIHVKYKQETGCHLLVITGKRYTQELRIYNNISIDYIYEILSHNLNEQFRLRGFNN